MPEYHQIETYTTINQDVQSHLMVCKQFLQELGWLNIEIENWLDNFALYDSNDNVEHSMLSPKIEIDPLNRSMDVRIMLSRYTPDLIKNLPSDFLALDIVFETQLIDDDSRLPQIRYTENARKIIWNVMKTASKFFPEYGIFFTDEAQEGVTFENLFRKETTELWQFECAIIFNDSIERFTLPNGDFFSKKIENQLWLARKFIWDEPLWETTS